MQEFKALCRHCSLKGGVARDVAAGMIEALNKADLDRIGTEGKDDWYGLSRCLGGNRRRGSVGYRNDAHITPNQISDQFWKSFKMAFRKTEFDCDISALCVASLSQPAAEISKIFGSIAGRPAAKITD